MVRVDSRISLLYVVLISAHVFCVDPHVTILNHYFHIVGLVAVQSECFAPLLGYISASLLKSGCLGEIWAAIQFFVQHVPQQITEGGGGLLLRGHWAIVNRQELHDFRLQ